MSDLRKYTSEIRELIGVSNDLYVPRRPGYRRVWYCTNRAIPKPDVLGTSRFSSDLGECAFGLCEVRVLRDRQLGEMLRPAFGLLTGFKKKKVVARETDYPNSSFEFLWKLQQEQQRVENRNSILFVHGFNTDFDEAIERAAQLAEDLVISGETFVFSWPSQGSVDGYVADQDRAEKSPKDVEDFILMILAALGRERGHVLHAVAHSMGNRALAPALAKIFVAKPDARLGEVILAAADSDVDKMDEWLDGIVKGARRISIYASATDKALKLSRHMHKSARVGLTPESDHRYDVIHCDESGDDWAKHSYIFNTPAVITDIRAVLDGRPCEERHLREYGESKVWQLIVK